MSEQQDFPCSLVIDIPFPTHRLANAANQTLSVDEELSPLVKRDFTVIQPTETTSPTSATSNSAAGDEAATVLRTTYRATTNRMLRVAVNGFFESLNVVLQVMEELDVDVVQAKGLEGLDGVQGVEQGMTGSTVTGG